MNIPSSLHYFEGFKNTSLVGDTTKYHFTDSSYSELPEEHIEEFIDDLEEFGLKPASRANLTYLGSITGIQYDLIAVQVMPILIPPSQPITPLFISAATTQADAPSCGGRKGKWKYVPGKVGKIFQGMHNLLRKGKMSQLPVTSSEIHTKEFQFNLKRS